MSRITLHILKDARTLIELGWCQGGYAETGAGDRVFWDDINAQSFCPLGAIAKAGEELPLPARMAAMVHFEDITGIGDIPEWNDAPERTLDQVLAAFDKAIETVRL